MALTKMIIMNKMEMQLIISTKKTKLLALLLMAIIRIIIVIVMIKIMERQMIKVSNS